MAVNLLTQYRSTTNATSYTTSAYTPSANALVIALIAGDDLSGAPVGFSADPSGNGITWAIVHDSTGVTMSNVRHHVWRGQAASPSNEGLTVAFTNTQTSCQIIVFEIDDAVVGNNGADAIVQAVEGNASGTGLTITLSSFADSGNYTVGVFGTFGNITWTADSGGLHTVLQEGTGDPDMIVEYYAGEDTSVNIATNLSQQKWGVGLEIAKASGGGGGSIVPISTGYHLRRVSR